MVKLDLEQVVKDYLEELVTDSLPVDSPLAKQAADLAIRAIHAAFYRFDLADCVMREAAKRLYLPERTGKK